MTGSLWHPYRSITLRWFTDSATSTAHSMLDGGYAACNQQITVVLWTQPVYWKSDMPEDVTACPACESILAGE